MSEKKLIVIAGPTAVGKTAVAIEVATGLQTVIVSADSRQMFREMTIGTAKPTPAELSRVRHHFVDSISVAEDYDAAQYGEDALKVIDEAFREKDHVVLCGGSGLYIKAVCEGFDEMPAIPEAVRQHLVTEFDKQGLGWLQDQMRKLDPEGFQAIDQQNPHRLIRALEVKMVSGKSIRSFRTQKKQDRAFQVIKVGLELPREELYARIDQRMDAMIASGLFAEAQALYPLRHKNALQTVGYQEIFGFFDKAYPVEECVRLLKRNSRRYVKRQVTWFKKDAAFRWFHPGEREEIMRYILTGEAPDTDKRIRSEQGKG